MDDRVKQQPEAEEAQNYKALSERVVYFADPMLTFGCDTIEEEFSTSVGLKLEIHGLKFENVRCTTDPPFRGTGRYRDVGNYDILFFDWGGMGVVEQKMMTDFCRLLLKDATEHPSRFYVVTSAFTELAMKDAMSEFMDTVPANMFLSIKDFARYYKVYSGIKVKQQRIDGNYGTRKLHLVQRASAGKEG